MIFALKYVCTPNPYFYCVFLGPAMQEEVLKLVLLALEDASALSRKVLVMFVVQRLEPHFPQASKTSIGHVVQLLYRASCFKVRAPSHKIYFSNYKILIYPFCIIGYQTRWGQFTNATQRGISYLRVFEA